MSYNWRETLPQYASISGVLAGFSITFIIFLLREDQSSQQIAYGVSWGILSALFMGISAVFFIQASQFFLTAKDHDIYGMPQEKLDSLGEPKRKEEISKSLRNQALGGNLFNYGRITLFLGVAFALWPFSQVVAFVVGAGGVGFEVYQIIGYRLGETQELRLRKSTSGSRKRYGFRTYLRLSTGIFIITAFYYVFTKLLDTVYGKFDPGLTITIGLLVLGFILGFGLYMWLIDRHGTLAEMLGAKEESK